MGATTSKVDGPLETLDADQVRDVVAGFGTQFVGAADKMREAGIDGDYLAHASDDDLAVVFEECGLTNNESYEGAVSPPCRLFVGAAEKRRKRDEDLMTIRSEFWLASPICHPPPVPARGTANSYEETHATPQEGIDLPLAPPILLTCLYLTVHGTKSSSSSRFITGDTCGGTKT